MSLFGIEFKKEEALVIGGKSRSAEKAERREEARQKAIDKLRKKTEYYRAESEMKKARRSARGVSFHPPKKVRLVRRSRGKGKLRLF